MSGLIGVISDTHGLLRPEAIEVLQECDCDLIIHAGDIGNQSVIDELSEIAPVVAVRGNIDKGDWGNQFPHDELLEYQGKFIYVLHNLNELALDPSTKIHMIISGHSHQPHLEEKANILYLNPGSAGPRRFKLPVAMARIEWINDQMQPKIIELDI